MDSQLLAFRLARPAEPGGDLIGFSYDPQSQTATWSGNGAANANMHCSTPAGIVNGMQYCNAYGNHCGGWGGTGKYWCDT